MADFSRPGEVLFRISATDLHIVSQQWFRRYHDYMTEDFLPTLLQEIRG